MQEYHALNDMSLFDVEVLDSRRAEILQHPEMALSCVRSNMLLTRPGFPAKHHIGEVWSYACIIHVLIGIVRA